MTPFGDFASQETMEKRHSTVREYLEALLIAVIFLGFTNGFLIKTFYIPSASMEETLLIGDHLFVNRFIYGSTKWDWERRLLPLRSPNRGDVVIFKSPERPAVDMVKRCIGLPGDEIQIRQKDLYVNGRILPIHPIGTPVSCQEACINAITLAPSQSPGTDFSAWVTIAITRMTHDSGARCRPISSRAEPFSSIGPLVARHPMEPGPAGEQK